MGTAPRLDGRVSHGTHPGRRNRWRRRAAAVSATALVVAGALVGAGPATASAPADDDVLAWLDLYRSTAALGPVTGDATLSAGARAHSEWMLTNATVRHAECVDDVCSAPVLVPGPAGPVPAVGSTVAGHRAAEDSNLFASTGSDVTARQVVDAWMAGPFHLVNLLSPRLRSVGYGEATDPGATGGLRFAAALDVIGGTTAPVEPPSTYPIAYPADGSVIANPTAVGTESPDPLASCPSLTAPTGAPLLVQLADLRPNPAAAPSLTAATFGRVDALNPTLVTPLPFCAYDGSAGPAGYGNPDAGDQALGRSILGMAGAIVVIPATPLVVGSRYRFTVAAGGTTVRSTFRVGTADEVAAAPAPAFSDVPRYHAFADEIRWLVDGGLANGFPDGTFKPTNPVSRQAMASFLWKQAGAPVVPCPKEFPDVPVGHPFRGPICWLIDQGLTQGFPDGMFKPAVPVSRQAAAAFLHRLEASPQGPFPDPGFGDVGPTHLFRTPIAWMVDEGLSHGFPDGTFKPTAPVSRQAMASFLYRYHFRP